MDAGLMDRMITFESASHVADAYGLNSAPTWTEVCQVWARVQQTGGNESVQADQRQTQSNTTFTINFRSDLNPRMRITYNSQYYNITNIQEQGYRAYLLITAEVIE